MDLLTAFRRYKSAHRLLKSVRRNDARLSTNRALTAAQEKEIKQYYRDLTGMDVPLEWHHYFYRRTGVYSVKYIPTTLYYNDIIGRVNQMQFERAYSDKNLTETLLSGIKQPETVLKNMNGYFYMDGQLVDKEVAVERCRDISDVIIKPSMQKHGDGVRKFSSVAGQTSIDGLSVEDLFKAYCSNFIIQQVVHQH